MRQSHVPAAKEHVVVIVVDIGVWYMCYSPITAYYDLPNTVKREKNTCMANFHIAVLDIGYM